MIITEFLDYNAWHYPLDIALVEIDYLSSNRERNMKRRAITWKEFDQSANRFANMLISRGIKKGDRVALLLSNCLEWLPIYFGILKAGALAVPLSFRYTSSEIKYCVEKTDSSIIVFGTEFSSRIAEIYHCLSSIHMMFCLGKDCPIFAERYETSVIQYPCSSPDIFLYEDDNAAIYFTSGTTGLPKAILHGHKALVHSCLVEHHHHCQTKTDVFLCIPPLYHTGATMHWFGSLITGGKAVLLKGSRPTQIMQAVSDEKCSIVWLLVPWAQDILDEIDSGKIDLNNYNLDTWRLMHMGAQPIPTSLIGRWLKRFPNHLYDTNYGLSEAIGPGCVHLGVENIHKAGSIGKAGYGWRTKIVDDKHKTINRGSVGELAVSGPGIMKCYYNDKLSTDAVLIDGWLFTGDMVKEDEEGFIYLVGRKKDIIISGGEKIYPAEIENFIRGNKSIKDVAVIGIVDRRLGEIPMAVVEVEEGFSITEEDIMKYCFILPKYKRPHKIVFDNIPRNSTGKIEKNELRRKYNCQSLILQQIEYEDQLT